MNMNGTNASAQDNYNIVFNSLNLEDEDDLPALFLYCDSDSSNLMNVHQHDQNGLWLGTYILTWRDYHESSKINADMQHSNEWNKIEQMATRRVILASKSVLSYL